MNKPALTAEQASVFRRYAELSLPRHTSYPSPQSWSTHAPEQAWWALCEGITADGQDLEIYVHVPFCRQLCLYCGCTREIYSADRVSAEGHPGDRFLVALKAEIKQLPEELRRSRRVRALHLGGGTPTFLTPQQMREFFALLAETFRFSSDTEIAVEIDPRVTSPSMLTLLRQQGATRLSIGVQDFDPEVQEAIGRRQSLDIVRQAVFQARALGFESINFDLIYGLPRQTIASIGVTLDNVIDMSPDRIAFFRLAMLPDALPWQRALLRHPLPGTGRTTEFMLQACHKFSDAGYELLGIDHFVKPPDKLFRARQDGTMVRNFQGMSTGRGNAIIGLGPSAISQTARGYAQNTKEFRQWEQDAQTGKFKRSSHVHSLDDRCRIRILQQLYCFGAVDLGKVEQEFGIEGGNYFAGEIERLQPLVRDGLAQVHGKSVTVVKPLGQLLTRVVASVFDPSCRDSGNHGVPGVRHASQTG